MAKPTSFRVVSRAFEKSRVSRERLRIAFLTHVLFTLTSISSHVDNISSLLHLCPIAAEFANLQKESRIT